MDKGQKVCFKFMTYKNKLHFELLFCLYLVLLIVSLFY